MKKIAIVGFTGELMCFAHALFNAREMLDSGYQVKIIIEGRSTALIPALFSSDNPFRDLFLKLVDIPDLITVCQACANKMGTLKDAEQHGLTIEKDLMGHPSLLSYIEKGYKIVTI